MDPWSLISTDLCVHGVCMAYVTALGADLMCRFESPL